ncbi:MAG: hypothetical protein R3B72_36030 [Polyangiaceae bacterium]
MLPTRAVLLPVVERLSQVMTIAAERGALSVVQQLAPALEGALRALASEGGADGARDPAGDDSAAVG